MAMPLRCAASLRLADEVSHSSEGLRPDSMGSGQRPPAFGKSYPASQRLAAHLSGIAMPQVEFRAGPRHYRDDWHSDSILNLKLET